MQGRILPFRDINGLTTTRSFGDFGFLRKEGQITDEQDALLVKLVNAAGISEKTKVFVPNLEKDHNNKAKVVVIGNEPKAHHFAVNLWYNFLKLEEAGDAVIVLQPEQRGLLFYSADCPIVFLDVKRPRDGKRALVGMHAGWRGLTQGIIENVIKRLIELDFHPYRSIVKVVISPHLCLCCSEYKEGALTDFFRKWKAWDYPSYYCQDKRGRVLINFIHIIQGEIESFFPTVPITPEVLPYCTCCKKGLFFSHRAESPHIGKENVGRFAVLIIS